MTTVIAATAARAFTRADLEAMPDDGYRRELIDGALVVTPSPSHHHQRAVKRLALLLDPACPPELEVLLAPFDVALADDTIVIPDVLVARRSDLTDRDLPTAPLLAVEVLSPSTRRVDLALKRSRYEAAGVTSYWVIDPLAGTLIAWDLVDGRFAEVANVAGGASWTSILPYPVTVDPAALVADY